MSWIQQESRRRQGSWVASMPRQRQVMVGYAKMRACPLVGLVGACCSGCAQGKGCGAKDDPHVHAAFVGDTAGFETAIPWEDVEKTNATIDHVQEAAAALASAPSGTPEAQRYAIWNLYYTTWHIWFLAAKAGLDDSFGVPGARFIHGASAETYKSLALGFNEQLKALEVLKVQSTAAPIDTRSPAGKVFDDTVSGVSGALGGVGAALTWVAIAGAVGLALYFGGPLLLKLAMRGRKK